MKLSAQAFAQAILAHVAQTIIPQAVNPASKWMLAGAAAAGAFTTPKLFAALQMAGVAEADGSVDVDKLEAFLKGAFAQEPKLTVPLLGLGFDQTDADVFIKRLHGG